MKHSSGCQIFFSKHHKCKMHSQCSDTCMLFLKYYKLWSKQMKANKTLNPTIQCNFINLPQTLWSRLCPCISKAIKALHKTHFTKLFFYQNFHSNFCGFCQNYFSELRLDVSLLHTKALRFGTMKIVVGVSVSSNTNTGFMHIQCCNNRFYWPTQSFIMLKGMIIGHDDLLQPGIVTGFPQFKHKFIEKC